jgi:hypothetical protein
MNKTAKDLEESAVKIAGNAIDALQAGDNAKAKFLAEQAALARAIAKHIKR